MNIEDVFEQGFLYLANFQVETTDDNNPEDDFRYEIRYSDTEEAILVNTFQIPSDPQTTFM